MDHEPSATQPHQNFRPLNPKQRGASECMQQRTRAHAAMSATKQHNRCAVYVSLNFAYVCVCASSGERVWMCMSPNAGNAFAHACTICIRQMCVLYACVSVVVHTHEELEHKRCKHTHTFTGCSIPRTCRGTILNSGYHNAPLHCSYVFMRCRSWEGSQKCIKTHTSGEC